MWKCPSRTSNTELGSCSESLSFESQDQELVVISHLSSIGRVDSAPQAVSQLFSCDKKQPACCSVNNSVMTTEAHIFDRWDGDAGYFNDWEANVLNTALNTWLSKTLK